MDQLSQYFSVEDNELRKRILGLMNSIKFDEAIEIINNRLSLLNNCTSKADHFLKSELAGFLIDIGDEGGHENAALKGLSIIQEERENLKGIVSDESIEYNLGNAKSSLFKIQRKKTDFKDIPRNIKYAIESKNHYWKSYKITVDRKKKLWPELIINLANALSSCGRISESLQYYDIVLVKFPDHPMANASRAKELLWLIKLSGVFSINLLYQSKVGYEKALMSKYVPIWQRDIWKKEIIKIDTFLNELGFNEKEVHKELEETKKENETLSNYRKYCIDSHLTLSEHSLYCNCKGARRDDLLICTPFQSFDADFIPRMEKILNRLKSELSLARLLYYYSTEKNENEFNTFDSEVMFTELFDSEYIGTKSEMLRTSFRLCFGILDKIAMGICLLFDLANNNENIYFENFWKPNNATIKQKERWEKINSIYNISLVALYTQATDLNSKSGEWNFFKKWRNTLEHNQFVLFSDKEFGNDIFNIYKNNPDIVGIDKEYFINKTLQMLQLTRSAIFNFVYLVRNEAQKSKPKEEEKTIKHTFRFKNDYEL
ncbi:MAG: hypothetical protein KAU06_07030 [Candidatus Marinimicrobia bacterium]|nr:hypothetical protein [Candidatus Neomarinimicrobiota bacterium]